MFESESVEVVREVEGETGTEFVECVAGYEADIRTCEMMSRWRSVAT